MVVAVEAAVVAAVEVVAVAAAEVVETEVAVEAEAAVGKGSIRQVDLAEARLLRKKGTKNVVLLAGRLNALVDGDEIVKS